MPRTISLSAHAALLAVNEAWQDANLNSIEPERIGLIVGGSNFQQRELTLVHDNYHARTAFIKPGYAMTFMDTDVCALLSDYFGIKGMAYTVGGASASGQLALIQALTLVASKQVEVAIVVGALMDLSYWECQSFSSLGAMGSRRFADAPLLASRPCDQQRDGFIFGEACAAVVVESADAASRLTVTPYAQVLASSVIMDANRTTQPNLASEIKVVQNTLAQAGLTATDIDYVKPHASGSVLGDATEIDALTALGLQHAYINTGKSVFGHGLSAAGLIEVVATLIQMRTGLLHPSLNLAHPINPEFNWVQNTAIRHDIQNALCLSLGFGGINTALCLKRW